MPRPYFSLDAPDSGSATPVDQVGQVDWLARFAAARADRQRHREERRRAQAEFAEARRHGLAARHATKLARLRAARALGAGRGPAPRAAGHVPVHDAARAVAVEPAPTVGGPSCVERAAAMAALGGPSCGERAVATEALGDLSCVERAAASAAPTGVLSTEAAVDRSACPQSTVDLLEAGPTAAPAAAAAPAPAAAAAAEPGSTPTTEPAAPVLVGAVGSVSHELVAAAGPAAAQLVAAAQSPVAGPASVAVSPCRGRGVALVLRRRRDFHRCVGRLAALTRRVVGCWPSAGRMVAGGRSPPAWVGLWPTFSVRPA